MTTEEEFFQDAMRLNSLGTEALIEELGRRVSADMAAPSIGGTGTFGSQRKEFFLELGQKWWQNLEPELMNLVCDPNNKDIKDLTGNKSIPKVASGLAVAAVAAAIHIPATWLIVATTLLANKLSEAGLKALCQIWSERAAGSGIIKG